MNSELRSALIGSHRNTVCVDVSLRPITSASDKLPSGKKTPKLSPPKNFPYTHTFSYFSAFFCADERRSAAHARSGALVCVLNIWRNGAKEERGRRGWTRRSRFLLSESVEEMLKFVCAKLRNPNHDCKNLHLNSF